VSIAPDGSVTIRAGILRVREESSMSSVGELFHFDTAEGAHELNKSAGKFVAFLGESFTIVTSAQGRILELNTDDFYAAIAENRVAHEDRAMRIWANAEGGRRYKNNDAETRRSQILADGEKAVREANDRYGSRVERKQAYIEQAVESRYYGTVVLRLLFNNALAPLPPEPVRPDDSWAGPVMLRLEGPMELAGTYTFEGVDNGVCAIQVEARRTSSDSPIGAPPVTESKRIRLAGGYRAKIEVDLATGSVLSREAVMDLSGLVPAPPTHSAEFGNAVPVTSRATVTVEKEVETNSLHTAETGNVVPVRTEATVSVVQEAETNSLKELRAEADKVLKRTNVSARVNTDVVFKLVERLLEDNQLEDAEEYITRGLELFPWNLEYQMIYAELLAKTGRQEKAEEKATLVLQYGETGELIGRARKLFNKDRLPEFPEISTLPGANHCIVLVPLQECDKWLILRIEEGLSATLGVPVYIQTINAKYPPFSRDRRSIIIDRMRQRLIEEINHVDTVDAMKELNLTREDLDEEDNFLKLAKHLLRNYDAGALEEFEAYLEDSRGNGPQWNADQLQTILSGAVMPYRRKNVAYLGITSVDIYARDYNFLFGWANRLCGIMSYRRFTADFNDDVPNQERLVKRALMQSLSSVGLIYGLKRCTDPTCARAYPHSLSEHDAKKETLCSECRKRFRTTFGEAEKERGHVLTRRGGI
jgi:predicted Zn-dependent protease